MTSECPNPTAASAKPWQFGLHSLMTLAASVTMIFGIGRLLFRDRPLSEQVPPIPTSAPVCSAPPTTTSNVLSRTGGAISVGYDLRQSLDQ